MTQSRATWKQAERRAAALVAGRRVPVSGRIEAQVDIVHEDWSFEHKNWSSLPKRVTDALGQAEAAEVYARRLGREKPAVLIVHEVGSRHEQSLVVMRMTTFKALIEKPPP
jgi:hypothetical protein